MRLVDFLQDERLTRLKAKMGIAPETVGFISEFLDPGRLTLAELEKLVTGDGIETSLDQVVFLADGTMSYKDSRVVLYIRDVRVYGGTENEPRFHLAHCSKLKEMALSGRMFRYVVAAKPDGVFALNIVRRGNIRNERRKLLVCQNCLHDLAFEGFDRRQTQSVKYAFVGGFSLERFFKSYPQSLHRSHSVLNNVTSPLDDYVPHWNKISEQIRNAARWQCQKCSNSFYGHLRKYLHVHHIGLKHDNRPSMLKVLRLGCHAKEPYHTHLRNVPDYAAFRRDFPHLA